MGNWLRPVRASVLGAVPNLRPFPFQQPQDWGPLQSFPELRYHLWAGAQEPAGSWEGGAETPDPTWPPLSRHPRAEQRWTLRPSVFPSECKDCIPPPGVWGSVSCTEVLQRPCQSPLLHCTPLGTIKRDPVTNPALGRVVLGPALYQSTGHSPKWAGPGDGARGPQTVATSRQGTAWVTSHHPGFQTVRTLSQQGQERNLSRGVPEADGWV